MRGCQRLRLYVVFCSLTNEGVELMSLMPKNPIPSLRNILRYSLSELLFIVGVASPIAIAQNIADDPVARQSG